MAPIDDLKTIVSFSMTSPEFQESFREGTESSVRAALANALAISPDQVPQAYVDAFMPVSGTGPGEEVVAGIAQAFSLQVLSN